MAIEGIGLHSLMRKKKNREDNLNQKTLNDYKNQEQDLQMNRTIEKKMSMNKDQPLKEMKS